MNYKGPQTNMPKTVWFKVSLANLYFLCELEFNVRAQIRVSGKFSAELFCLLRRTDEPQEWRNSCRRPQPRSVLVSFGVVLLSCKVDFHVVRSALQNSIVYVAKSPFLLTQCESQDVCTVKAWLRGNSGGRRHFEYA